MNTDLISILLSNLRMRTRVFHHAEHCSHWHIELPGTKKALFHLVTKGVCEISITGANQSLTLHSGDLILFPRPEQHQLSAPRSGSSDTVAELLCAYVEFDPSLNNPLFEALPDYIIVKANAHQDPEWLQKLLSLLNNEARSNAIARETVIERLTDILCVHSIRCYLSDQTDKHGILAALTDPALTEVIKSIHAQPEEPWNIEDFAQMAKLSRSSFIDKFTRTLGMPPKTYLKQQRLEYAHRLLTESDDKIIAVALASGYETEASFSKAFKRQYGIAPRFLKQAHQKPKAHHH